MKTTNTQFLLATILFWSIGVAVGAQTTYFRVIGGIPHLPVLASTAAVSSPTSGTVIYSTADAKPRLYTGSGWVDLCTTTTFTANAGYFKVVGGLPIFPVKSSASNTNSGAMFLNTGSTMKVYAAGAWQSVSSLTGTLTNTSGSAYNTEVLAPVLSSNPAPTGLAAGAFYINSSTKLLTWYNGSAWVGLSCVVVIPGVVPSTITLATNQKYFVASVYDTDYLPYTAPTGPATTATVAANGVADLTANVQGTITTTGVTVSIPVTATGSSTLPAYSTTVTIPAALTEDGIACDLTLSWASQSYTSSTKSITATLKAVGGTLNAKKLDINAGLGNDYLGVLLGQLVYPYNNAGTTTYYSVRDIAGIPDKMFGLADNGGVVRHNFLYIPVTGEDGKVWLNNNLGADYANASSTSFNPAQQATSSGDYHAYGSMFQWGRKPDGHELMTYTKSSNSGEFVTSYTSTRSNSPAHANWIVPPCDGASPAEWRVTADATLWATASSPNNPCPSGYRVPTATEFAAFIASSGSSNSATAAQSHLHLPSPGEILFYTWPVYPYHYRPYNSGGYWTSTAGGTHRAYSCCLNATCSSWRSCADDKYACYSSLSDDGFGVRGIDTNVSAGDGHRSGYALRCIQN